MFAKLKTLIQIYYYTRLFRKLYFANLNVNPQTDTEEAAIEGFLYFTGLHYRDWFNEAHKFIGSSRRIYSRWERSSQMPQE